MTLFQIITAVQDASGKNAKRDVLKAHAGNELLKQYLKAVYDPRINYYITKMPKFEQGVVVRDFGDSDLMDLKECLADRQLTGKAAKTYLAAKLNSLDAEGRELLGYLIGRDIRAGIAENTVLDVFPGLFYCPPYQRCASMSPELKERFGQMPYFYVQTKSDGQFCYAIKRKPAAWLNAGNGSPSDKQAMSRAGSLYPDWLANHITYAMPEGYVAMGELLVVRDGKTLDRKTGNGILNSVLSGDGSKFNSVTDEVRFLAWDMVTEEEFDAGKSDTPYEVRLRQLTDYTKLDCIPTWKVKSVKEANELQRMHTMRGEEGTVWKNPEMGWRDCSSGDKDMMKAKTVFEAEYRVRGYYEGKGKAAAMLGGLELASEDDLIEFNCGSGYSDDERLALWANRAALPGQIVTAEGNDIVTSKSKPGKEAVFLPIFSEFRFDKKVADDRARVGEQFNAAKEGRVAE